MISKVGYFGVLGVEGSVGVPCLAVRAGVPALKSRVGIPCLVGGLERRSFWSRRKCRST